MTDISLTPAEHEHCEGVVLAAQWLADEVHAPQPVIFHLRQRFNLSAMEACEASALASRYRAYRRAHG